MSFIKKEKIIQKVYKNIDSSVSSQLGTSSYEVISGSNAAYEPHDDSSHIVYDLSFVSHSNSSVNHNLF